MNQGACQVPQTEVNYWQIPSLFTRKFHQCIPKMMVWIGPDRVTGFENMANDIIYIYIILYIYYYIIVIIIYIYFFFWGGMFNFRGVTFHIFFWVEKNEVGMIFKAGFCILYIVGSYTGSPMLQDKLLLPTPPFFWVGGVSGDR